MNEQVPGPPGTPGRVLFTDLDGTLLDPQDYRPSAEAEEALASLLHAGVAVVPVSSKTAAEVGPLIRELGLKGPAVTEGGAVVLDADGRSRSTGPLREELLATLRDLQSLSLPLRGMSEMTAHEVSSRTGLSEAAAERAMKRTASEPFVTLREPSPEELERLHREAAHRGAAVERGGRFWHLQGAGVDKGTAVAALLESWPGGRPATTAAVGDAWNDLPMLVLVDVGFLLGDAVEAGLVPARVTRLEEAGPPGFVEAVRRLRAIWRIAGAEE